VSEKLGFESEIRTRRPPLRAREEGHRESPRPFVKWVGGKTQLLSDLIALAPRQFHAYHEPFTGGGALFFALVRLGRIEKKQARLTDINRELIATYLALRDEVEAVIEELSRHEHDRDHYYRVRAQDPWRLSSAERAARLIFLNRTGFNGLYRVNRRGEFNVPFGRYENPRICDEDNLRAVSAALSRAEIEHRPFEGVLEQARAGDLVYFDPPYVPLSATASFVSYAQNGFDLAAQERLADVFEQLADRGVFVMLSNSDTDWVRERYARFDQVRVSARRNVNSKASSRGPIGELIVVSGRRGA
jgi:DNA adenine methylase